MRHNKSWKKEEKIHHVGQDAWGLTHKSCTALHCVVWDSWGWTPWGTTSLSVLPQTCSANLDLPFKDVFLTWDSQPLFEVLRYSAVMMNITEACISQIRTSATIGFLQTSSGLKWDLFCLCGLEQAQEVLSFLSSWLCLQSTKSFEQASTSVQHGTNTIMQISELP